MCPDALPMSGIEVVDRALDDPRDGERECGVDDDPDVAEPKRARVPTQIWAERAEIREESCRQGAQNEISSSGLERRCHAPESSGGVPTREYRSGRRSCARTRS